MGATSICGNWIKGRGGGGGMMRTGVIVLCLVLWHPAVVLGKSLYVRDNIREALVRTGPTLENKIIAILKPGQEVTLAGEEENHYIVVTPNGSQGYVLKYQMTDQSPAEKRLQEIEQRTQQKIKDLETQTQTQEKELIALREERSQLEAAKKQAEERAMQHADMIAQLQAQQSARENEEAVEWFLAGAGVLLLGVLFGRLWGGAARKNKRASLPLR
jgi:SH3 domain protein